MERATQASPGLGLWNLGPVLGWKEAQCLWGPLPRSAFGDYFLCAGCTVLTSVWLLRWRLWPCPHRAHKAEGDILTGLRKCLLFCSFPLYPNGLLRTPLWPLSESMTGILSHISSARSQADLSGNWEQKFLIKFIHSQGKVIGSPL